MTNTTLVVVVSDARALFLLRTACFGIWRVICGDLSFPNHHTLASLKASCGAILQNHLKYFDNTFCIDQNIVNCFCTSWERRNICCKLVSLHLSIIVQDLGLVFRTNNIVVQFFVDMHKNHLVYTIYVSNMCVCVCKNGCK